MEIKATLDKPYDQEERIEFIRVQNRINSYEIRETDYALEAWGYTQEEIAEQKILMRNQEIDEKIKELQEMALSDVLQGNTENVEVYNSVIDGLEEMKE